MSFHNDVTIEIYEGLTRIQDISNDLEFAENIVFATHIPGGDYGDASFFIERDVTAPILFDIGHRVVFLNEQEVVYEGFICGISRIIEDDYQGIEFLCVGPTTWYLMKYPLEKRWADTRIGEDVWTWITTAAASEKCDLDRNSRLMFVPKNVAWVTNDKAGILSTQPKGQTAKYVTFNYDLTTVTGATNWTLMLRSNPSAVVVEWSVNRTSAGSSTGSATVTLTPHAQLQFILQADGNYTPPGDGTLYGKITSLVVYSETSVPITMKIVADDIVDELSGAGYINSSKALIQTAGTELTIEPFITNGYPSLADILDDIAGRGDGTYARWIWGMRSSDSIPVSDGKPVLYLEPYPLTTDWEYEVTFGDENIASGIELLQDALAIANHIITSRTDLNGRFVYYTPSDDANLADATSKADYRLLSGVRLDAGDCGQAEATAYAMRFKATYKDPPFKLMRPLVLVDYIRRKDGSEQPVRLIRPGERIKLVNFISTLSGIEPVFVITSIGHTVADDMVSLTAGIPGAPIGARQAVHAVSDLSRKEPPIWSTGGSGTGGGASGSGGSGSKMNFNWYERYGKYSGLKGEAARKAWLSMSQAERNKWKTNEWKKFRKNREKDQAKKRKARLGG